MCNTLILLIFILLAYLLFKNKNILVVGVIVILLSYYFNYREGMTAAQKKAKINKSAVLKAPVVKKVNPKVNIKKK
jgi:hypothetical protein